MACIYVSSTFKDLVECRDKVRIALKRMGHEDIGMEYYVAEDKIPVDKCLEDVASCDLYIGIFAWRYGFVPRGYDKSITELEYRKAVETEKYCLIFLLHENAPWPRKFIDKGEDQEKIEALRNELSDDKIVSFFESAEELASLVGPAVRNWEIKSRIGPQAKNQRISNCYNPSILPYYPDSLKSLVIKNRAEDIKKSLEYIKKQRTLIISGVGGVGKSTLLLGSAEGHECPDF